MVAVYVAFQADQRGGGPPVHQALVQHVVRPEQLPFPAHQEERTCNLECSKANSRLSSTEAGLVRYDINALIASDTRYWLCKRSDVTCPQQQPQTLRPERWRNG